MTATTATLFDDAAPDPPGLGPRLVVPAPAGWPAAPGPTAYHGLLGEIVRVLEPETEADPVAILAQLLVAFGTAVGRGAYFQIEATRHHPHEFLLLVGDTARARICCAQHILEYVALRTMLRMGSGARRASDCLRAERALCGRRRFQSLSRERNIFSAGLPSRLSRCGSTTSRSTRRTCTSRPARNSSDACSIAMGRRVAKPGRWHHEPRCSRSSRAFNPPKLCCVGEPDPLQRRPQFDREQHISERNIGEKGHIMGPRQAGAKPTPRSQNGSSPVSQAATIYRDRLSAVVLVSPAQGGFCGRFTSDNQSWSRNAITASAGWYRPGAVPVEVMRSIASCLVVLSACR